MFYSFLCQNSIISLLEYIFQFRNEVKEKLEIKQKELTEAKKESRKRKKMIAVYQVCLITRSDIRDLVGDLVIWGIW